MAKKQLEYSFTLKCKVKRKMTLLTMKVKAEGYSIQFGLYHSSPGKEAIELPIGRRDTRTLDFGQVQIHEKKVEVISVVNRSLYNLEYRWSISTPNTKQLGMLSIEPQSGEVVPTGKIMSYLSFLPSASTVLENSLLTLEVWNPI